MSKKLNVLSVFIHYTIMYNYVHHDEALEYISGSTG